MPTLFVPDDFRAFMKSVVVALDTPGARKLVDSEDAFVHECGHGGRIDGLDTYRFKYFAADGHHRWDVILREAQLRDIADGLRIEVEGERFELVRTHRHTPVGEPLLIWGAFAADGLRVGSGDALLAALDALHLWAAETPKMVRLWSASDDQLVVVLWGGHCALYIIESADGYATSTGDQDRNDSFEVLDHEGATLRVPWADCVSWDYGRRAMVWFLEHSDLGDIPVEGRIPSLLLMMGDVDRRAVLAARPETPRELVHSSLHNPIPIPVPVEPSEEVTVPVEVALPLDPQQLSAWARRLVDVLRARALIELVREPNLDEISAQLGGLLQAHARDAEHSLETADWLAIKICAVPGVSKLFATGGDLQRALRELS